MRRWFGWSSGRLLVLDIGGGSLEVAAGLDEEPDVALSLPLGAGRLTREQLPGDPPSAQTVRERAREGPGGHRPGGPRRSPWPAPPDRVVGSSKTLRSLARVAGAAASSEGPFTPRSADPHGRRALGATGWPR